MLKQVQQDDAVPSLLHTRKAYETPPIFPIFIPQSFPHAMHQTNCLHYTLFIRTKTSKSPGCATITPTPAEQLPAHRYAAGFC